jgi:hypothetical protein
MMTLDYVGCCCVATADLDWACVYAGGMHDCAVPGVHVCAWPGVCGGGGGRFTHGVKLERNLREVKSVGGLDTLGIAVGEKAIRVRARAREFMLFHCVARVYCLLSTVCVHARVRACVRAGLRVLTPRPNSTQHTTTTPTNSKPQQQHHQQQQPAQQQSAFFLPPLRPMST